MGTIKKDVSKKPVAEQIRVSKAMALLNTNHRLIKTYKEWHSDKKMSLTEWKKLLK